MGRRQHVDAEWLADRLNGWPDGRGPMYLRMASALERLILNGQLTDGDRLPAERTVADELDVSRTTVSAAYSELESSRLVTRQHGSGTYVTGHGAPPPPPPREAVLLRSLERNEIIDGLLQPPRDLLDLRAAALHDDSLIDKMTTERLGKRLATAAQDHGYLPAGVEELRDVIARRYTDKGLPTGPDEVLITSGAQQAMALITMLHLRADDLVVTEALTHTGAIDLALAAGAQIRTVPISTEGADVDAIEDALSDGPTLLYLIPSVNNPTGTVMPARHRRRLAALLGEHPEVIAISDDTLADTWRDRRPPPPLASYPGGEQVLHIGSVSKLYWGGIRVGWIRGPVPEIRRLARMKAIADLGTSIPSQLLALDLLHRGEEFDDTRRALIAGRGRILEDAIAERLPDWRFVSPQGGLSVWIQLPDGASAREFSMRAARHGVAVAPGSVQSPDGSHHDHLRLTYGQTEDLLEQAVHRLAAAWNTVGETAPLPALGDLRIVV